MSKICQACRGKLTTAIADELRRQAEAHGHTFAHNDVRSEIDFYRTIAHSVTIELGPLVDAIERALNEIAKE